MLLVLLVGAAGAWFLAFYLPQRRARQLGENERNAGTILKTLASAQADFRANDRDGNGVNDFWTGDIAGLLQHGLIPRELAAADARPLVPLVSKPVAYMGYYFVAMETDETEQPPEELRQDTDKKSGKVHHRTKFAYCAYPVEFGVTGRNSYIINENNTIRWSYTQGDAVLHWPSDDDMRQLWAIGG